MVRGTGIFTNGLVYLAVSGVVNHCHLHIPINGSFDQKPIMLCILKSPNKNIFMIDADLVD